MDNQTFLRKFRLELRNSSLYFDPKENGNIRSSSTYYWIGTRDGIIGNENCHYELTIENDKVYVDIHFEGDNAIKFKSLEADSHYDWEKNGSGHQAIRLNKMGFKISDPDIINKIFEELDSIENKVGKRIRAMLDNKGSEYLEQLKNCHNIVFTGAPGTGKTYTAKQIAAKLISEPRISGSGNEANPVNILKNILKSYSPDLTARKEDDLLLKEFVKEFPIEEIKNISLDDYCLGTGERGSFCWYLEKKLKNQGLYFPGQRGSYVYGIFKRKNGEYSAKDTLIGTTEGQLDIVLNCIYECVKNYKDIKILEKQRKENYVDAGFILKILNTYYPDEFIQINSKGHFENIVKLFSLPCENKKSIFYLERSVFDFYSQLKKETKKDFTTMEFMRILYSNFNIKKGELSKEGSSTEIDLNGKWKLVQFHQSYDYTDFVEGLRPCSDNEDSLAPKFKRKNGVFKDFCNEAIENPNKNFVFIIDEINRGEPSKIFGELFYSIDSGYRGKAGLIQTQYQNLIEENSDDPFKDGFYVPENLYIIGTMNDIDRSVDSLDFAFRRRFNWIEVTAKESQKMFYSEKAWKNSLGENISVPENINEIISRMDSLNAAIENHEYELGQEYQIGAAYFLKYTSYLKGNSDAEKKEAFTSLWHFNIEPLIKEYIRGSGINIKIFEDAYNCSN